MARILVTGAAGFIGKALCSGLVERGHEVIGWTRNPAAPIPGVELRLDRANRSAYRLVRTSRPIEIVSPSRQPRASPDAGPPLQPRPRRGRRGLGAGGCQKPASGGSSI